MNAPIVSGPPGRLSNAADLQAMRVRALAAVLPAPVAPQAPRSETILLHFWRSVGDTPFGEVFHGSVGHVAASIPVLDGRFRLALSQFPTPHFIEGRNTFRDPHETAMAESRDKVHPTPPDLDVAVRVPDFGRFQAQADHERDVVPLWFADPLSEHTTNCVVSVFRSLRAGGIPIPHLGELLTPDRLRHHVERNPALFPGAPGGWERVDGSGQ